MRDSVHLLAIVILLLFLVSIAGSVPDNHSSYLSCPPGFVVNASDCVCVDWPNELVICDEKSQRASLQFHYCMTYDEDSGEVSVGDCPHSLFRTDYSKFYIPLPGNVTELDDHMCRPSHTTGVLCGECKEGFAAPPFTYIHDFKCVDCTHSSFGWLKYILLQFLPLTVILLIVVACGFSAVSSPINAFIFFSQVTTAPSCNSISTYQHVLAHQNTTGYRDEKFMEVLDSLYSLWNLEIFRNYYPAICLSGSLTGVQAFALKYIEAIYPLIFIAVLYVCIELHARDYRFIVWCWKPFYKCFLRFRRTVDPRATVVGAFATFTLLSYVKLLMVSRDILTYANLYHGTGEKSSKVLVYYDTSDHYLHGEHLPFAILAIFVLLTFVAIPLVLLLLYPTSLFQKCLTCCRMNCYALHTFADVFQGCYKDGTNGTRDYRYFAGFYFVMRIIVILFTLVPYPIYYGVWPLMYLLTVLSFSILQPYKKHIYNSLDSLVFGLLVTIYIILIFHSMLILYTGHHSVALLVLVDVLYTLPLVCVSLFVTYWLGVMIRKTRCFQKLFQKWSSDETRPLKEDYGDSFPDRVVNPGNYELR